MGLGGAPDAGSQVMLRLSNLEVPDLGRLWQRTIGVSWRQ